MTEKPFYKSKKFAYAVAGVVTAVILALLPSVVALTPETEQLLEDVIPAVILMCALLLTGHTVTDVAYAWAERPQAAPLGEALHELIDATPLGERSSDDPEIAGDTTAADAENVTQGAKA
ncbi:hypothetical protein [Aggregatilinea lenta]|uniref:hypothetical protein n=1 Tax=Aggregatilinea lenta TaxID=913108 RepID=UPI0013C2A9A1|nr:hypothetical protein [Aggregatilinea lenta]